MRRWRVSRAVSDPPPTWVLTFSCHVTNLTISYRAWPPEADLRPDCRLRSLVSSDAPGPRAPEPATLTLTYFVLARSGNESYPWEQIKQLKY